MEDIAAQTGPEDSDSMRTAFDGAPVVMNPEWTGPRVLVYREPENVLLSMPRKKTARQLLASLGLYEETALVARGGELLTPDRRIWPDEKILVRTVVSRG